MLMDFGVDPRAFDTMGLGEITSALAALRRRRGKVEPPSEAEEAEALQTFAQVVANDPSVRLH